MKSIKIVFLAVVLCSYQTAFAEPANEVILGLDLKEQTLDLHVASNGCTKQENFNIEVNKGVTGAPPYQVTVKRIKADYCKALIPDGVWLSFDRKTLGLEGQVEFMLTNRVGNGFPKTIKKENNAESQDPNDMPVSKLIGKHSRIYKSGDALTQDFRPDRVNIEVDDSGKIVKIWMG